MLTKIREKAQGAFAWGILIIICVPFALWGIQNYLDNGKEMPVASVGDKDFYQRDINKAYEQYSQNLQGAGLNESTIKTQALNKLIKDEVLLQYVHDEGLAVSDDNAREFIKSLPYFQVEGKFDEKQYKSVLSSQRMTSGEFASRIKNALVMEQFQRSVIDSSIATQYDVESFFKIQNQLRDVEFVKIPLQKLTDQPSEEEITAYYQQHQEKYQTPEQVSIEYVELSLDELAKKVAVTDDKLKTFYDEQKDQFTTPERRKISHILFAATDKTDDKTLLEKALAAKKELDKKDFATLAAELSDDKLTAKSGGDLGLFNVGVMEKAFEEAASALKLGEVSNPVKSAFGYHLIKVTELVPVEIKSFDAVKTEVAKAYQKAQAETAFYEAGETLTEMSFQNPDSLQSVADALNIGVKKSSLFVKDKGEGIASEEKIRNAAFSEEVLKGANSSPVELGADRLVVLRTLEHKQAAPRALIDVKQQVIDVLLNEKAKAQASSLAQKIKSRAQAGESLQAIAAEQKLEVKKVPGLARSNTEIPAQLNLEIFKAAKPIAGKPNVFTVALAGDEQVVVSLSKITPGVLSEDDKKKLDLARKNIAKAFGQTEFNSVVNNLQQEADIQIRAAAVEEK